MSQSSHSFLYRNSLSIVFLTLLIVSLVGQIITGHSEHNEFLMEHGATPETIGKYLISGHFIQATFENWESEFFQMALFVILTSFLKQQGSSESKKLDDNNSPEKELQPKPGSPRAVIVGGWRLTIYKYSLSIVLMLIFAGSFMLHWLGSWIDYNEHQTLTGKSTEKFAAYLSHNKFWFESFQNWQSEFLSVLGIVFLSIYLRQIGSPQSKPVNAPHKQTGPD